MIVRNISAARWYGTVAGAWPGDGARESDLERFIERLTTR